MSDRIASRLKGEALRHGASRVGICRAEPVPRGEALLSWLAAGHHAGMAYMARDPERRVDPSRTLAGARSCLVIAVDHAAPRPAASDGLAVAAYAGGRDYHDVLRPILEGVGQVVAELGGRWRASVDTGPLLERELAMAAGLGFIGKNTNLIDTRAGSYHLLGVLLTDLDLPADPPATAHCGTCTRCLDLCPTEAFPAPYVLDARRCLSYLTIENRGEIPRPLRDAMGPWVFGCDICQEVCPWNRKARPAPHPDLAGMPAIDAGEVLAMDDAAFRARFRGTAISRAKLSGLKRNVLAALGGRPRLASLPALRHGLRDASPMIRRHAAFALGRLLARGRRRRTARTRSGSAGRRPAGTGSVRRA